MAGVIDEGNVEIVLAEFSKAFNLDFPVGDETLGIKMRRRLESLVAVESPNWGTPGELSQISSHDAGALEFYYRPHLFPGMSEPLRLGHALQFDLLPRTLPENTSLQVSALLESYCHLSGDLIGWHQDRDDLVLWIADVSGHGVRAGLAAAVMYFLIGTLDPTLTPVELISTLNHRLIGARQADDREALFLTAFVVRIDNGGRCSYVSAGHPDMLIRRVDGSIDALASTGLPIGLFEQGEYLVRSVNLEPGDGLFLFTDGVVEVQDENGAEFGRHALQEALMHSASDPQTLIRTVYERVTRHCPSHALDDDMTFLAAQRIDTY